MLEEKELKKIEESVREFFLKMTMPVLDAKTVLISQTEIALEIELSEPQILIGQGGQTLFEIQRILRIILNKKFQQNFLFNLDINNYKKKKIEYLKSLAKDSANQVALTKEEKVLPPMSAYERRIIHTELSQRTDIATESSGDGTERHIIIKSK
jgi:spoIIIJ-associated protein